MVLALAAAMKLFLDIDGVLHSEPAFFAKAFCRRGILIDLLDARPHLEVVISSDWRLTQSLDEIAMQIVVDRLDLRPRFIGITPYLEHCQHEYRGREQECLAWLEAAGASNVRWLAIDDVAGNFTYGSKQVFLTDYRTGLTQNDLGKLLELTT